MKKNWAEKCWKEKLIRKIKKIKGQTIWGMNDFRYVDFISREEVIKKIRGEK